MLSEVPQLKVAVPFFDPEPMAFFGIFPRGYIPLCILEIFTLEKSCPTYGLLFLPCWIPTELYLRLDALRLRSGVVKVDNV